MTDPQTLEHADIPFTISYSSGAPRVDSISASAGLAPQSQITTADLRAPLPRFSNLTSLQISSLSISPGSAPQGSVGAPYTAVFTASGGSSPYTWSAGNLPPGLSITTNSGIIGGTPTVAGSFQITVGVTDATQSTTSIQASLDHRQRVCDHHYRGSQRHRERALLNQACVGGRPGNRYI